MTTRDKRSPAFIDTDPMPFGQHKGEPLQDVPASYLAWMYGQLRADGYNNPTALAALTDPAFQDRIKLANYLHNSKEALELELGHEI